MRRTRLRVALAACAVLAIADSALAEVVRVEISRRDDWATHERIIGRVYFAIDPQ